MKRMISLLLIAALGISLTVRAFAAPSRATSNRQAIKGVVYSQEFKSAMDARLTSILANNGSLNKAFLWRTMDKVVASIGYGGFDSYTDLSKALATVNRAFDSARVHGLWQDMTQTDIRLLEVALNGPFRDLNWIIELNPTYGYLIIEKNSGLVLCNSSGAFPYYKEVEVTGGSSPDGSIDEPLGGKWVRVDKASKVSNIVSQAVLDDIVAGLQAKGERVSMAYYDGNKYGGIQSKTRYENGIPMVYCDEKSRPYRMQLSASDFAVNQDNNYYTGSNSSGSSGDTTIYDQGKTENNNLIDVDNNTIWFPDGTLNYINNLFYDESTKTYYVDAHQEYDIDNNTYITNNYYYEYHINYTSITYIGASEEYNKTYELYYQLPDGRSSADLTAEELKALNVSVDVVPYIRSTDNTALRSLYHFDGNVKDSSYWNYATSFDWKKGASITYLESNAFNGCLYLDETEHEFQLTLPSSLASSDFTLQWRMYNSYTAAPVSDSSVSAGSTSFFTFSGSYITFNGTQYAVPVGNWYEVALIRTGNTLRLYLNGLQVASKSFSNSLGNRLTFSFGDRRQTYVYLDELRVLNYALVKSGVSYTPTSVPYDTNLALVLPDSVTPVADEYWSFSSSKKNLLTPLGMDAGPDGLLASANLVVDSTAYTKWTTTKLNQHLPGIGNVSDKLEQFAEGCYPKFFYRNAFTQISEDGTAVRLARKSGAPVSVDEAIFSNDGSSLTFGLFSLVSYRSKACGSLVYGNTYTLSMVDQAGNVGSVSFTLKSPGISGTSYPVKWMADTSFNGYKMGLYASLYHAYPGLLLAIQPTANAKPFIYLELVEGDSTDLEAEYITAVAPVNSDFKTPTLAVRTDLEITGHQIGGVRPSLPEKGLVWALVEGGRMTSLQIYNGQAWEQVDGRIWTGSRWVPYYAYDVLLLKDLYDVIEGDPSQEYIYTEQGFWSWFQRSWNQQLITKLDALLFALGGGSGPDGPGGSGGSFFNKIGDAFSDGLSALIKGVFDLISIVLEKILGLAKELLSFFFDFLTDSLMSAVRGFFSLFSGTDGPLFGFFQQEGLEDENGEPTMVVGLPSGVAGVFAFFSGAVMALPVELRSLLIFGVAAMFLFSVFKMVSRH